MIHNLIKWNDIERNPYHTLESKYELWSKWDDERKDKIKKSYKRWLRDKIVSVIDYILCPEWHKPSSNPYKDR